MRQPLGRIGDFAEGLTGVAIAGRLLVIARLRDDLFALEDRCSHEECALSEGVLEGGIIICPCHGAEFDAMTGEALAAPAFEAVPSFPVVTDGADLYVVLP